MIQQSMLNKNKMLPLIFFIIFGFIFSIIIYYYPSFKKYNSEEELNLIINGNKINASVYKENNEILIPINIVKTYFDPYFYYDNNSKTAVITTKDKVIKLKTDKLTGYINSKEIKLNVPIRKIEDKIYVPINTLSPIYHYKLKFYNSNNNIVISNNKQPVQKALITNNTYLRTNSNTRSPWIKKIKSNTVVSFFEEKNNWLKILTADGYIGYINENSAKLTEISFDNNKDINNNIITNWIPWGEKINLTWDVIYSQPYQFHKSPQINGVNVVSPTWFHLKNNEGDIHNSAYKPYVEWAHKQNCQVWALFSNSFDPDITHEILSNPEKRTKVKDQLLILSEIYNLDGINFDFENIYYDDRELYVQFIRELTPFLHEQGLIVSLDVTVISQSKRWSLVYDRKSLSNTVDYMMIMAYDQYPRNSKVAGPVSSISWTENNLKKILNIVPSNKIILGIPFYTRLWEEKKVNDNIKLTSSALSMSKAKNILVENNVTTTLDKNTGLLYGEFHKNNSFYKIWLETDDSIKKRIELVKKYNLAGLASWRRGFEENNIWNVIEDFLN